MNKTKYILPLLTLCCLIGCQKETPQASHVDKQILRVNNQGDLSSLHPHTGIDLMCRTFQKSLFEGLTRINLEGKPELAGAQHLEISPSKLLYTFTLRPMQWTNGEEVSAFHFEKAWKDAISPHSNCLRSDLFYPIKNAKKAKKSEVSLDQVGVRAIDNQTLVVELEHPTPYFLDLIANSLFSPLYDEADNPTVFNGPFNIKKWEHDHAIILEKNPYYWDSETVQLDTIEVSLVNDPNTAILMYEKKEIDWVGHPFTMLPQDFIEKAEKSPDFISTPISGVFWLCLNTKQFPLNSTKIRQALSIALDRDIISEHVVLGETPTKSLVPITVELVENQTLFSDSNTTLAIKLFQEGLEELNLSKETFPALSYSYSDIPGQKKLAEAIQQKWEQTFGIKVDLTASEWNVFFSSLGERQYQIGGCIWFSVFNDPVYTLEFFKDTTHRYNASQWENLTYQTLLDLADLEPDPMIRLEHLKQAEKIIVDDMPIIPLYVFHAKYLKSPKVKNLIVNDLGQTDFKWTFIQKKTDNHQ